VSDARPERGVRPKRPEGRGGRARRAGRGFLGTLFTAILVVAAGFSVGVVAGLALEDPSLVKDYVGGDAEKLELGEDPRKPGASDSDSQLRPPQLERVGFSVQVGAFADGAAARHLAEELENDGYPVFVAAPDRSGGERRWRVRVGPVSTRVRAESIARELKSKRSLPTWVLDESAS
jgi:hypothetical protein